MAIPSLAMIPSGYKDGKVYSVLPSNGDGDFTFSRGSNATRVNKDGLIETITGDTPRLDYSDSSCPSLLLEPQSTNLIPYSEDFSNAAWVKGNVILTPNQGISPDGLNNAFKYVGSSISQNFQTIINVSSNYTYSFYVKTINSPFIRLRTSDGSCWFNMTTNAVATNDFASAEIKNIGNNWYRLSVTSSSFTSSNSFFIHPHATDNTSIEMDGSEFLLWGAQVEEQSYPTSYIPTNGATATRLADVCNNAGTSDTFNDSEGVLMVEISALADSGNGQIRINEQGVLNSVIMEFRDSGTTLRTYIFDGNATNQFLSETNINPNDNIKIALKYKQNDCSLYLNGFVKATDTIATMPSNLNALSFDQGDGGNPFYGNTKQIQYYDTALTDSEIEELTSWESFLEMAAGQNYTIK